MYGKFEEWLDNILKEDLPQNTKGIGFNLYEEGDMNWSLQLIATGSFDENDEDWMCDEVFSTEENLFGWKKDANWEQILQQGIDLVTTYLSTGKYANILKEYDGIGIGFVDGDVEILYTR